MRLEIMRITRTTLASWAAVLLLGCGVDRHVARTEAPEAAPPGAADSSTLIMTNNLTKTDAEWRQQLTPEQYRILREKGTERAFTGKYWNTKDAGDYHCAGCGALLFASDTKFESECGWPSFYAPARTDIIAEAADDSFGMRRTEVLCARCGGHLGHVFNDGPKPTGLRYCINSGAIQFEPAKK